MPSTFLGLLHRRECLLPTARGWLAIFLAVLLAGAAAAHGIYGFLATQDSVPGGVLVVEGWAPDYALAATLAEARAHRYEGLFVTGGPMEHGEVLSEYKSFAELSAAILLKMGADPAFVHAVPAPSVRQDRTYASAVALRQWLRAHRWPLDRVNVMSLGAHSRRTRLLYTHAFGPGTRVGIIAIPPQDLDSRHWWRSSQGVRTVLDEAIAWTYARLLFHPDPPAD